MEETKQNKFRGELSEKYLFIAFEALGLYEYYGKQYETLNKQIQEMEARAAEATKRINDLEEKKSGNKKTAEEKAMIAGFKDDAKKYSARVASVSELRKKLFEKSANYQTEGAMALEKSEFFDNFKLKTPEMIAADKEKPVEPKQ